MAETRVARLSSRNAVVALASIDCRLHDFSLRLGMHALADPSIRAHDPLMAETWFFHMEGRDVVMLAWSTGPGGIIGGGFHNVEPGGSVLNLSYDELAAAVAGRVVIENGVARIETHHARLPGA